MRFHSASGSSGTVITAEVTSHTKGTNVVIVRVLLRTLQIKQIDVRFLRQDVAVAHTQTELLGDARTKNPRRTLVVMILTQEADRWLIAVLQNTEINRPPELNR
jgi:hypothetical protein